MNTIIKIMAIFFVCLLNFGNTTTYIQEITYEIKKLNCWDKYIVPDNKIAMLSNLEIDHILSVVLNDFILTGYNDKCAKITGNKYTEIHEKNVKKKALIVYCSFPIYFSEKTVLKSISIFNENPIKLYITKENNM